MCTNRRPFKLYMQQDFLNFPRGGPSDGFPRPSRPTVALPGPAVAMIPKQLHFESGFSASETVTVVTPTVTG